MEFYETLEKRRSVRMFEKRDVEPEKLERILHAVRSCPTAGNLQAYRVHVFKDEKRKADIAKAAFGQRFIAKCSMILLFSAYPDASRERYADRGKDLYAVQDATIACTFAHLTSVAEGLGSVWVGAFDTEEVQRCANLPHELVPVAILPIGYPRIDPKKTQRKPFGELVVFENDDRTHPK